MIFKERNEYREILNILKKSFFSLITLSLIKEIILVLYKKIFEKNKNNSFHKKYYPADVKRISDSITCSKTFENTHKITAIANGPRYLKLASGTLKFSEKPNWKKSYDDYEQFVSLHRWNWLLHALTEEPKNTSSEWGESLIRSWLATMTVNPSGDASYSYTVGERISNACLFFRQVNRNWYSISEDIVLALHTMAIHLSQKIEYYSGNLSGNHVINNSRALLFAGHCCNDDKLILLGKTIMEIQLPKIIDKYGFLREGSSTYQLLVTRWLLEIRMLALELDDQELFDIIQGFIPNMLDACNLLLVKGLDGELKMPTIGDVSPDCNPQWLINLLDSPLAGSNKDLHDTKGWASLFADFKNNNCLYELKNEWPNSKDSSWIRLDYKNWTAIFHVEESSGDTIASHAHHDFSSFVLYFNGKEIVIDPGRFSYDNDTLSLHGLKACSHNTIQLNGFPPMLSKRDKLLPRAYKEFSHSIELIKSIENFKFTIKHNGFSRLSNKPIEHSREFLFSNDSLEIHDYIRGKGVYFFESFFQWPKNSLHNEGISNINIMDNLGISFELLQYKNQIETEYLDYYPYGWRFPSYLEKKPCLTQRCFSEIHLPLKIGYKINIR